VTDREILERAVTILGEHDFVPLAREMQRFIEVFHVEPDPPQPQGGREVRIAVAICDDDLGAAWVMSPRQSVEFAMEQIIHGQCVYQGIVTAVIPEVSIPTVTGKVETP
jgi:hypothetical protein